MQRYEIWAERELADTISLDVFAVQDPEHIDLLDFVRLVEDRASFLKWTESEACDVEGCLTIAWPEPMIPVAQMLRSPAIPVLCVLAALEDQGWEFDQHRLVHRPEGPKTVDVRSARSKRVLCSVSFRYC